MTNSIAERSNFSILNPQSSILNQLLLLLWLFIAIGSLSGCTSLAFSGASAAYDGYRWKERFRNERISLEITGKIKSQPELTRENSHITVTCFDYKVLLTGKVLTAELRPLIAKLAANVEDVERVYNFIDVGPLDTTSQILHDAWLTAQIKGEIVKRASIDTTQINVVTENGTVYLLGILTHDQANEAVEIARTTEGTKRIIKIFKYINYSSS